jgi:transcriptional regulator GlxA family with amidase domain
MATPDFLRTRRIGILIFNQFEPLDVWGFTEAFTISRFLGTSYASPPPYPFEVVFIAQEQRPIQSMTGPHAWPDLTLAQALEQSFDVLMIPGGNGVSAVLANAEVMAWVVAMDAKVEIMASVCTGAAVLASCGLLDGRPAATNHQAFDWVASLGPRVLWDSILRWVDAGKFVTSAGVSAGTDMGFYLVKRLAGRAVAENSAKGAEYDWHRDPETPIHYPSS